MQVSLLQTRLEESKKYKAPFLDLGNFGLTTLPEELSEFTWLEDINFGTVYWDEENTRFQECINDGPVNYLIKENFKVLSGLPKLRRLSLRNCSVRDLHGLGGLKKLESLTLGGNGITDISPLNNLTQLKVLSLFDNELEDIASLDRLHELEVLSLNYNKIQDISVVSGFHRLRELHLAGNQITDLEPIRDLPALEKINLNSNQVRKIWPLTTLPQLHALSLDRNPIEDCPPEIAFSGDVARIRAYFSTMTRSMPAEAGNFDVQEGEQEIVKHAPPVKAIDTIPIMEVKLILVGNATSGKTSLSRILRNEAFNNQEKTTHGIQIHEWLLSPEELQAAIPDVFTNTHSPVALRVNIWDFGGQEYYHGTHQIFLDNNAVYLLLWDATHNANLTENTELYTDNGLETFLQEHFQYKYWLDNIRFHASGVTGGEKPPLVVAQNKIDLLGGKQEIIDPDIINRYAITHVAGISAKSAKSRKNTDRRYRYGFEIFREDLVSILYNKARQNAGAGTLPDMWLQVRQLMRELRSGAADKKNNPFLHKQQDKAWLTFEDFRDACRVLSPELSDPEVETLAYYLHQIGAVVWLPHIDRKVFTDPSWVTGKIYRVLNEQVRSKAGRFSRADVEKEIGDAGETELVIKLMREWEIIFPDNQEWVAPQYLPEEHPMENLFNIALTGLQDQFFMVQAPLFHYRKILRRLVFLYGNDPTVGEKSYWKHGILFVTQGERLRVFIKGLADHQNSDNGLLMICVERGKQQTDFWRQKVFTDLLSVFFDKPGSIAGSDATGNTTWLNPANTLRDEAEKHEELKISLDGKDFVSLPSLLKAARDGFSAIVTENRNRIRLQEFAPVLQGLQITPPLPTIFFSYSHDDKPLRDALDKHLAPLRRTGRALSWYDGEIGAGQNWEETIKRSLLSADVILLLISSNFINSEFIWNNELEPALRRHENGECRVIPVLLRPCLWQELPFAKLQMLPHTADTGRLQAVSVWRDPDEAYAVIANGIKQALEELNIQ